MNKKRTARYNNECSTPNDLKTGVKMATPGEKLAESLQKLK
jgi:hypothetical protein